MNIGDLTVLLSSIVTYLCIYEILALSTNIEYGYTGIPNFGKVFYYAVGAIASANVAARIFNSILGSEDLFSAVVASQRVAIAMKEPGITIGVFILSMIVGVITAGIFGYLSSYPALRLSEDFLAITLLVFGEAGRIISRTYEPIVGGVYGMGGIPGPFVWINNQIVSRSLYTIMAVVMTVISFIIVERIANSPYGRILKAIRDDELVANVLGKDVAKIRGQVLFIGSAMAGLAGVLYTFYAQSVFPDDFIPPITFFVISMILLGGTSNNVGVVLGALLLTMVDRMTQASFLALFKITIPFDITYIRYMIIGLIMILILMLKPEGLIPEKPVKTPAFKILREALRRLLRRGEEENK